MNGQEGMSCPLFGPCWQGVQQLELESLAGWSWCGSGETGERRAYRLWARGVGDAVVGGAQPVTNRRDQDTWFRRLGFQLAHC